MDFRHEYIYARNKKNHSCTQFLEQLSSKSIKGKKPKWFYDGGQFLKGMLGYTRTRWALDLRQEISSDSLCLCNLFSPALL